LTKKLEINLQVFGKTGSIRRIMRVFYPNLVSNKDIVRKAGQRDYGGGDLEKVALDWALSKEPP
jgi:hypothetical protein